jgi:HD superfamily phosphohydrolase
MKFIRDPLYDDFIIVDDNLLKVVEHYAFQRLRRISQLGLVSYIYPGATHTRFSHSLGVMHLITRAIEIMERKGIKFDNEIKLALKFCALVHDVGHGPFSHALEWTILNIRHEDITKMIIDRIFRNVIGNEIADISIKILNNEFEKKFVNELISSQLDMDRLDYIRRDAFYCGVHYGIIDIWRILQTLTITSDYKLAIEKKGKHAVEGYLVARYLMYWSVYFHKTNLSLQAMLSSIFNRLRDLIENNIKIELIRNLEIVIKKGLSDDEGLNAFLSLEDGDMFYLFKIWLNSKDKVLSDLSRRLLNREIFKVYEEELSISQIEKIKSYLISNGFEPKYYLIEKLAVDTAYEPYSISGDSNIRVILKDGSVVEISNALPTDTLKALSRPVKKRLIFIPQKILL